MSIRKEPRGEPTQPGNPHQLTRKQHVHSAACIRRFTDENGEVWIRRKSIGSAFPADARNAIFCADRAWDERAEKTLFAKIERDFQPEADHVLRTGKIESHIAISAYVVMWQKRVELAEKPKSSTQLVGISGTTLTKDQEETLESKGVAFVGPGGIVPSRMASGLDAAISQNRVMFTETANIWGIITGPKNADIVCPDNPNCRRAIPISPAVALVAGHPDAILTQDGIDELNLEFWKQSRRFVFGSEGGIARLEELLKKEPT